MDYFNNYIAQLVREHFLIREAEEKLEQRKAKLLKDVNALPDEPKAAYHASVAHIESR